MKEILVLKILLLCSMVFALGACSALPEVLKFNLSKDTKMESSAELNAFSVNDTNDEGASSISQKSDLKSLSLNDMKTTQKRFDELIDEWSQLKPSIVRVIKLEDELAYLIESFNATQGLDSFRKPENEVLELTNAADLAAQNFVNTDYEKGFDESEQTDTSKFSSLQTNALPKPVVGKATALPSLPDKSNIIASIDSKFSGQSESLKPEVLSTRIPTKLSNTKISSDECAEPTAMEGDFAIHLSSISVKANLRSAATNLRTAFAKELCHKVVKSVPVNVNGVDYLSIRFGPYENQQSARQVCLIFSKKGQYCKVTKFEGLTI